MAEKQIKARVLVDTVIEGIACKCNGVVLGTANQLKPYLEGGSLDKSKAAVDFALSEGAEPISLGVVEEAPADNPEPEPQPEPAQA